MASPYASQIEVVQAALHRVGEAAISSLSDGSLPAQIAASNYRGIVNDYLTRHAWTFATRTEALTYVGEVELGAWTYKYSFASTALNIRRVMFKGGRTLEAHEWDLQDGYILTYIPDGNDLQIEVTYSATEDKWPADFSEAVVIRLQAVFLEGLLDKWQDARLKEKDAEAKLQRAMSRDKRQVPARRAERPKLADRWRGWRGVSY